MTDDLIALFDYNRWADELLLEAVRPLTPEQYVPEPVPGCPSVRTTLVHMADAALIWARRLNGEMVTARITDADVPTLAQAEQLLAQAHETYRRLLPTLPMEQLAVPLSYVDLKGEAQSLPVWAVLRHVVNHSSYHRGQITASLMRFGIEPPLLDLALWMRAQE